MPLPREGERRVGGWGGLGGGGREEGGGRGIGGGKEAEGETSEEKREKEEVRLIRPSQGEGPINNQQKETLIFGICFEVNWEGGRVLVREKLGLISRICFTAMRSSTLLA